MNQCRLLKISVLLNLTQFLNQSELLIQFSNVHVFVMSWSHDKRWKSKVKLWARKSAMYRKNEEVLYI